MLHSFEMRFEWPIFISQPIYIQRYRARTFVDLAAHANVVDAELAALSAGIDIALEMARGRIFLFIYIHIRSQVFGAPVPHIVHRHRG